MLLPADDPRGPDCLQITAEPVWQSQSQSRWTVTLVTQAAAAAAAQMGVLVGY